MSDTAATSIGLGQATSRKERIDRWIEIILAVILGAVSMATAWSGYQAARWGGEQAVRFSEAGALRTESTRTDIEAGQLVQIDIGAFTGWATAYASDDENLQDFYYAIFRDEFRVAFDAWLATDPVNNPVAPTTPFAMPEYRVSRAIESEQLELQAAEKFEEGRSANQQSDRYILNAVILASVLFLAGIASGFEWLPVQVIIIVGAVALLGWGLYNLAIYPVI
jgi:hypothetical protein